jgi:hypothetical protein
MVSLHKKTWENVNFKGNEEGDFKGNEETSIKVHKRIAKSEPKISFGIYKCPIEPRFDKESSFRLLKSQNRKKSRSKVFGEVTESPLENCEFINIFKKEFSNRCKTPCSMFSVWKNIEKLKPVKEKRISADDTGLKKYEKIPISAWDFLY